MLLIKYILLFIFVLPCLALGANVYVDTDLSSDCSSGGYSASARDCSGSDGNAYNTLQEAIWGTDGSNPSASAGDTILLRGGTYTEAYGDDDIDGAAMQISTSLNGTAWTDGDHTTIMSYPGEWAILDGLNTINYYFTFGLGTLSSGDGQELHYIKIERLGITKGYHAGIGLIEGPFIIRYCDIYNNGQSSGGDENKGGVVLRRGRYSTVEFNRFYQNGGTGSNNPGHIVNYADYLYSSYIFTSADCNRNNIIRYNYMSGTATNGYADKATQYLADYDQGGSESDFTNKEAGNKIHHNIIEDATVAVKAKQSFEQVYNNISDGGAIDSEDGSTVYPVFNQSYYNNTVIGNYLATTIGYSRSETSLDMGWFAVNNIVDQFGVADTSPAFGIAVRWGGSGTCGSGLSYTWTNTTVDRNLVHSPTSGYHFGNPSSYPNGTCDNWPSTATFNTQRSVTNYTNSTADLFSSGYVTDGSFVVSGSTTIADGGIGGNHPYLSGVTLPSYIGATNPSDNSWVAGVLNDLNATYFTSADAGSDPSWVEGAPSQGSSSLTSGSGATNMTVSGGGLNFSQ